MAASSILSDPRRRNLAILGAITLVALLLALGAIWQQADLGRSAYAPEQFFPGLARQVRNATTIHIA